MSIPTTSPKPVINAPGVMQAEMIYDFLGQKVENVYHFLQGDGSAAPTVAQMNLVAAALEDWEHTEGIAMRSTACSLSLITVRDLTTPSGPAVARTPTTAVTGVQTGLAAPGNVTIAIKWNTALRGRSFRGRTFHNGLWTAALVGNTLAAATVSDFIPRYDLLRTNLEAVAGVTFVVVSYAHNKFWRSTALATRIISLSIDVNLDSQRRRLNGRGT